MIDELMRGLDDTRFGKGIDKTARETAKNDFVRNKSTKKHNNKKKRNANLTSVLVVASKPDLREDSHKFHRERAQMYVNFCTVCGCKTGI